MNTSQKHKNRYYEAVQWIQGITTLAVLGIIYLSRNFFSGETTHSEPETPPISPMAQQQYWNEDFGYGFRAEDEDKYENKTFSGIDLVAVDPKEGVIFEDARVKVSFYPSLSIDEIEKRHNSNLPRAYSRLARGIAVIEGDLDSRSAKTILATLHTR